jgi:hypothetical protein
VAVRNANANPPSPAARTIAPFCKGGWAAAARCAAKAIRLGPVAQLARQRAALAAAQATFIPHSVEDNRQRKALATTQTAPIAHSAEEGRLHEALVTTQAAPIAYSAEEGRLHEALVTTQAAPIAPFAKGGRQRAALAGGFAVRRHLDVQFLRLSGIVAFVALLAACGAPAPPQTPTPQTAPSAAAAPPAPAAAPVDDRLTAAVATCNAQAQMIYAQVAGRLRGRSLDEQMQRYAAQLGPQSQELLAIRAQLERLYAAPVHQLPDLGYAVAGQCLGAAIDFDSGHARECFRLHQHPLWQRLYADEPPPTGETLRSADQAQLRCLRQTAP